ncbi:hypothetical protein JTE90_018892 [Oedothorax gibbosus]|uniref:Ankyrin repeat domain-containing protein 39 n=1 Tax=Oedothorax gibbosus TaxID=931172 RepID=A0AAV6UAS2_9ARAC|nr:hypothetical protein JTE90_018892 [Oedothorax gibbosus]
MSHHECSGNHGPPIYSSVHQTLDELSFEKGIWGAAFDGDVQKLEKLLRTTHPSSADSSGYTALHYAARNNKEEACRVLLSSGADPNAQTHGGATPLHRASLLGHITIVNLLLHYKADASICDSDGKTALHKAAERNHFAVAQVLVQSNQELKSMRDNKGLTPSECGTQSNVDMSKLLSL